MSVPPVLVRSARFGWRWQWNKLMNALAPADSAGNYLRPPSQHLAAKAFTKEEAQNRSKEQLPFLIIGRSCPWAHRTWLVHKLKGLDSYINLFIAKADHNSGLWIFESPILGCRSLIELYQKCGTSPNHRATVPALIDPGNKASNKPKLLGNESANLVEVLNEWPNNQTNFDLAPKELKKEIEYWNTLLQLAVNNGVYKCGFARNQKAYDNASDQLFDALEKTNKSLNKKGPWLCGEKLTIADIRLFPTLIRWEMVYVPLFGCSQKPLWAFPNLWEWRQRFLSIQGVEVTCNSLAWRTDYFGALFPLRPSNIIPAGPDLIKMVTTKK